jgi:23S rRNA A2030 N6-methylase RlmJ
MVHTRERKYDWFAAEQAKMVRRSRAIAKRETLASDKVWDNEFLKWGPLSYASGDNAVVPPLRCYPSSPYIFHSLRRPGKDQLMLSELHTTEYKNLFFQYADPDNASVKQSFKRDVQLSIPNSTISKTPSKFSSNKTAMQAVSPPSKISPPMLHPGSKFMPAEIGEPGVGTFNSNGFDVLSRMLQNDQLPGLVLIDPSFEMDNEFENILQCIDLALSQCPQMSIAVWYPILSASNQHTQFKDRLKVMLGRASSDADFQYRSISTGTTKRAAYSGPPTLVAELLLRPLEYTVGSGMLILNPPEPRHLDWQMQTLLPWLAALLAPAPLHVDMPIYSALTAQDKFDRALEEKACSPSLLRHLQKYSVVETKDCYKLEWI